MELSPEIAARLERARQGDEAVRLRVGELRVGDWGVLDVVVDQIHPTRTFKRKNGSEGQVGRVTVSDSTGSVDIVLWDGEISHESLQPGAHVTIHGATVKEGWKGGFELGLSGAEVRRVDDETAALVGNIIEIGVTDIVDGRFRADLSLETDDGEAHMVIWDDTVKTVRGAGVGARVTVQGAVPHPGLDGWYIADGATIEPAD